jgi:hypothetical protein
MVDKTNSSEEQYDHYLRENAAIVREWPHWMKEAARSPRPPFDPRVVSLGAINRGDFEDPHSDK